MKIQVTCKNCGRRICEVDKPEISDSDLSMYEHSASCEEHGPNIYEYDEEEILTFSEIHIIAIKSLD